MIFFCFSKKLGFWVFLVHPTVVSVLLSAWVERCFVSRMRDFFPSKQDIENGFRVEYGVKGPTKISGRFVDCVTLSGFCHNHLRVAKKWEQGSGCPKKIPPPLLLSQKKCSFFKYEWSFNNSSRLTKSAQLCVKGSEDELLSKAEGSKIDAELNQN